MLSILIPVYNYNVLPLVSELHHQASASQIEFEILAYDDGSTEEFEKNQQINDIPHCFFKKLTKNIGRSAIRNVLAREANYSMLLYVDAGTYPSSSHFVEKYLQQTENPVVVGGMTHLSKQPEKPYKLRWLYTKERESVKNFENSHQTVVCSSNFFIKKQLFEKIKFDESIKKYGCEDVIFFDTILNSGILIKHIDNPVIHDAKEDAFSFLKKTESAIENLIWLIEEQKIEVKRYRISSLYYKLKRFKLSRLLSILFLRFRKFMIKNLASSNPSLRIYDLYRLGYFCYKKNQL